MKATDSAFAKKLLTWWERNRRDFPWRMTADPYQILIAEVMLHRTKAKQAGEVFSEFIARFPSIEVLATAEPNQVSEVLKPLGLFWRTRLLHQMAVEIIRRHSGKIPESYEELRKLPGIGDYIGGAVASFAFGKDIPILDTNTVRILGRVQGTEVSDSSRRSKEFRELYRQTMDRKNPREFNLAMLDLGALVCIPRNPRCDACPVIRYCEYASNRVAG